jgi:hypothetical protein
VLHDDMPVYTGTAFEPDVAEAAVHPGVTFMFHAFHVGEKKPRKLVNVSSISFKGTPYK